MRITERGKRMQKPNLDRLWRVWIKIGVPQGSCLNLFSSAVNIIRSQVTEVVSTLETRNMINWYYFLIHGRKNDNNDYFDVVFSLKEDVESKDFLDLLATYPYCLDTEHLKHGFGETIQNIDKSLLKNEDIREAWRILGKQSEWIIDLVNIHNGEIPIQQFTQFMHFYTNPMGLGLQSILLLSPIFQF